MAWIDTPIKILNKPFPEQESNFGSPRTLLVISVFITFFLYIFQPFGIHTLESNQFLICLGFGSMTFVASLIFGFVTGPVLKLKGRPEHWTFGKWILNNLGLLLSISLANFLFARLLLFGFIDWRLFPAMLYGTFMVGIIPITVLGFLSLRILENKYKGISKDINENQLSPTASEDNRSLFSIPTSRIQYIEALQNYIYLAYIGEDGNFQKDMERATLKETLQKVSGTGIIQVHRSFLVNRNAVKSTAGNAQGLTLELEDSDRTIPVSRRFVPVFRDQA